MTEQWHASDERHATDGRQTTDGRHATRRGTAGKPTRSPEAVGRG
ncbi:MAG TPA: hypothetical protein VF933_30355 [Streptosporangiaceae bacterium]